MKKLFCLLIILVIPVWVMADASGPSIMEYKAVIINPNGVKVDDKVIPYNAQVTVNAEGEDYANVNYCPKTDDCIYGSVSFKDIMPLEKEIIPTGNGKKDDDWEASIVSFKTTVIAFEKDGIKLRKGPAAAYEKYDTVIPYDTTLEVTYAVSSYGEHGSDYYPWYYVNSGNYKGWLDNTWSAEFSILEKSSGVIVLKGATLKDENNTVMKEFASETELKDVYYEQKSGGYYMKQDGKWGKIEGDYYAITDVYALTSKKTDMISLSGKVKASIPFGTKIHVLSYWIEYNKKEYYYVEYNNQKGLILFDDLLRFDDIQMKDTKVKVNNDTVLYNYIEDPDGLYPGETSLSSVPKGTELNAYYVYSDGEIEWYLVTYNNKIGFVKTFDADETGKNNPEEQTNPPADKDDKEDIDSQNPSETPKEENNKTTKTRDIIIYSLIGALVISITSIVTIILVNKKKRQKLIKEIEVKKEEPSPVVKEEVNTEIKEEDQK